MLRLKENPREWQKFTLVMAFVANGIAWLLRWRHDIPLAIPISVGVISLVALVLCWVRPQWFRGFYRGGMTVSFHIGQTIGKVMLTLLFLLVVTPMGLILRLAGKDLLDLKKPVEADTYWRDSKRNRQFDRQF